MSKAPTEELITIGDEILTDSDYLNVEKELKNRFKLRHFVDLSACLSTLSDAEKSECSIGVFLLSDFEDQGKLAKLHHLFPQAKFFGLPAMLQCLLDAKRWHRGRPVFNLSFSECVVCFTGFREREPLNELALWVRWMGGSVRRNLDADVTHLIAFHCAGTKVTQALLPNSGVCIMKSSWISDAWASRHSRQPRSATEAAFLEAHRAKVFQECCLAFAGFPPQSELLGELLGLTEKHDGVAVTDLGDPRVTHVLVTDQWAPYQADLTQRLATLLIPGARAELPLPDVEKGAPEEEVDTGLDESLETSVRQRVGRPSGANQTMLVCGAYRVPVLRLDWFWRSLQQTCLCPPEHYVFVPRPRPDPLDQLRFLALDLNEPGENKENVAEDQQQQEEKESGLDESAMGVASPLGRLAEEEEGEGSRVSCDSSVQPLAAHSSSWINTASFNTPNRSGDSSSMRLLKTPQSGQRSRWRSRMNKSGDSPFHASSSEDLVAQLADPLSFPSNRGRRDRLRQMHAQTQSVDSELGLEAPQSVSSPLAASQPVGLAARKRRSIMLATTTAAVTQLDRTSASDDLLLAEDRSPETRAQLSRLSFTSPRSPAVLADLSAHSGAARRTPVSADRTPMQVRLEKREHRVFEYFLTETNYCDILRYLTQTAYSQVVDESQIGGAILPAKEADLVFGKLVPIYELHSKLHRALDELEANWSKERSCLSDALLPFMGEMGRVYGQYMEFFSATHLRYLGQQYPRFLAFMRQVERRKESGRQSLTDLLVRPVQRLPSVSLLIEGIAKFTPPGHPDHQGILQVQAKVNETLAAINDRLKKNEERISLYCLFQDISGAPPEMLSSSRSLVAQLEAFEIVQQSNGSSHLEPVTLFLLSDSIEVARPRRRHTGEPISHAIKAALSAVQGDAVELDHEEYAQTAAATAGARGLSHSNSTSSGSHDPAANSLLSRKGSGASNSSALTSTLAANSLSAGFGLHSSDAKQRSSYKHCRFIKLLDLRRVVDLRCESQSCAAFALIISGASEMSESVHGYCLAASVTASYARQSGKCPEPVESAVLAAHALVPVSSESDVAGAGADQPQACVNALQACVDESKRAFLHKLCHHAVQVSCLASSPDELMVTIDYELMFSRPLSSLLKSASHSFKSKKFRRPVGRNMSIKTPIRPTPLEAAAESQGGFTARRSVIGSLLSLSQQAPTSASASAAVKSEESASGTLTAVTPMSPECIRSAFDELFSPELATTGSGLGRGPPHRELHIRDVYNGPDDANYDAVSISSSCTGVTATDGAQWPAYPLDALTTGEGYSRSHALGRRHHYGESSSSLRSISSASKRSVFTRKSVCHSLFAGFKSIRRSIAGSSSASCSKTKLQERTGSLVSTNAPLAEVEDSRSSYNSQDMLMEASDEEVTIDHLPLEDRRLLMASRRQRANAGLASSASVTGPLLQGAAREVAQSSDDLRRLRTGKASGHRAAVALEQSASSSSLRNLLSATFKSAKLKQQGPKRRKSSTLSEFRLADAASASSMINLHRCHTPEVAASMTNLPSLCRNNRVSLSSLDNKQAGRQAFSSLLARKATKKHNSNKVFFFPQRQASQLDQENKMGPRRESLLGRSLFSR